MTRKENDQRKSSGFSFFGMRSKSKENVIDTNPAEDNAEEVKKLPTLVTLSVMYAILNSLNLFSIFSYLLLQCFYSSCLCLLELFS